MTAYTIYIVDDEAVARKGLSLALKKKQYVVKAFESAERVFDAMENIKKAFDEAGVSIPYPQQDVHMYQEQAA